MRPFDESGNFHPAGDGAGLRRLAIQGAGATLLCSLVGVAFHVSSTAVLARLLTPADFGLVTMVTTFSLLFSNFGLNGLTEAVLQCEKIDHALASNLFWICIGLGLVLTGGFAAAGSLMAHFYNESLVARASVAMSLTIVITCMSVLHLALLKRAMCFGVLSLNDLCARALSLLVSIVLAWMGWGYWALVAGAVALPLSQLIGAWSLCRWIPGLPRRVKGTGSMLQFACHVYGRFAVNYFSRNTDNLLVGWRFHAVSLGFYKKAYDLFAFPGTTLISSLSNVAVSALSRFSPNGSEYRRYLLNSLAVVSFVGMGLGGAFTLVGRDIIRFLLGTAWDQAGRIFVYFAPGIGAMLLYSTHGWLHLSIGRPDRWFRWGFVEFGFTAGLFVLALAVGPEAVALAWTLSFWILIIPAFWYGGKPIGLPVSQVIGSVWRYAVASLLAGAACVPFLEDIPVFGMTGGMRALIRIVIVSAMFGLLYLLMIVALHRGVAPIRLMTRVIRDMIPLRRSTKLDVVPAAAEVVGRAN